MMLILLLCPLLLTSQQAAGTPHELVWTVEELDRAPEVAASLPEGWMHQAPLLLQNEAVGTILRDASGWKQRLLRPESLGPEVDEIRSGPVAATPDRRHIAYAARRDGRTVVILDERIIDLPDGVIQHLALSPDGQHVAYVQLRGPHAAIGLDGADLVARCGGVGIVDSDHGRLWCVFPPDGSSPAFALYDEKNPRPRVWWKGASEQSHLWVDIESLVFSPDSRRLACSVDGDRVVVMDESGVRKYSAPRVASRSIVFSPDSQRIAWADQRGVHLDGELLREETADGTGAFPTIGSPLLRSSLWLPGASEPAYVVQLSQGAAFRKDGRLWREADGVRALAHGVDRASGRVAVEVRRGGAKTWMVEGTPGELFPTVGRIAFAADGRTVFCGGEMPVSPAPQRYAGGLLSKSPLAGALQRLEGDGSSGVAPRPLALYSVVCDGRKTDLPPSLDLQPPTLSLDGRRIAYRTASSLSNDRMRALSPGVCVVDLDASPPAVRVHVHPDSDRIEGAPVFSPDGRSVAYIVNTSYGVTVAVDGACADRSYLGVASWPNFMDAERVELTAIRQDATGQTKVPITVTLRPVGRTSPIVVAGTPPTNNQPNTDPNRASAIPGAVGPTSTAPADTTQAKDARRPPRELFRSALRMQPESYWYIGNNTLSDAEISQADEWCRKKLAGQTLEFDAVLEGLCVGPRVEGGTEVIAVLSCEALLTVDRGPVDLVLDTWMPGMMELQVERLGVDPSFMPYRRPFLWQATLPDPQLEQVRRLVGQYLPVRSRVGLIEDLGAFVGRPNILMGTDAMAFLAVSLYDTEVAIPERGDAGIEAPPPIPPSIAGFGEGGAPQGATCGLCDGTGYLRNAHGANVGGMSCVACSGRGRR